jgi:CheY-like chemotaxis protein
VRVVDHDQTVLFLVARLLGGAGYAALTAPNASQAVMQAHRETPHVILADMLMPAGGGMMVL